MMIDVWDVYTNLNIFNIRSPSYSVPAKNNVLGDSLPQFSIEMDIYHKITDTFNYFNFDSCTIKTES